MKAMLTVALLLQVLAVGIQVDIRESARRWRLRP
jgi:hypothetical protein